MKNAQGYEIRMTRFAGIIDPKAIEESVVLVVGCGAVGRQAAIMLASSGVGRIDLVDHDDVDEENLGPQAWDAGDVGRCKVEALGDRLEAINPDIDCGCAMAKFEDTELDLTEYTAVFVCVDNMDVRKEVVEAVRKVNEVAPIIEARMGAEVFEVWSITDQDSLKRWLNEWYDQAEANAAEVGDCTTKATVYCANMCAGTMVHMWTRQLRDVPVPCVIHHNIMGLDMFQPEPAKPREEKPKATRKKRVAKKATKAKS